MKGLGVSPNMKAILIEAEHCIVIHLNLMPGIGLSGPDPTAKSERLQELTVLLPVTLPMNHQLGTCPSIAQAELKVQAHSSLGFDG